MELWGIELGGGKVRKIIVEGIKDVYAYITSKKIADEVISTNLIEDEIDEIVHNSYVKMVADPGYGDSKTAYAIVDQNGNVLDNFSVKPVLPVELIKKWYDKFGKHIKPDLDLIKFVLGKGRQGKGLYPKQDPIEGEDMEYDSMDMLNKACYTALRKEVLRIALSSGAEYESFALSEPIIL